MKRRKTVKSVSIVRNRPVQNGRGIPHVASADPNRELRAHSTRITITLPRDLTEAIAEWRMLQLGQSSQTAILELIDNHLKDGP